MRASKLKIKDLTIPFLISGENERYWPMRLLCEAMGLNWHAQAAKLQPPRYSPTEHDVAVSGEPLPKRMAYYADTVVGHQNINTGNYVTIDKQSPEASYIALLFYSVPLTALWFLFFFVGLSRWNQGCKGIDLITANSPWPGGAHYTALQGKIVTMILGAIAAFSVILMLSVSGSRPRELVESVLLGGVVAIFGGSVVLSIALYQIEKTWIRNRIDFQAYVQETVHAKVAAFTAAARSA